MATTVNNSTLTTSTTDRIILNGVTYGSTTSVNSTNSDEVYNRIMTIPAYAVDAQGNMTQDFVSIVSATPAPNSAGDVDIVKFQYARITNLDDTYPIMIRIADDTEPTKAKRVVVVAVPAGASYLVHEAIFFANTTNITAEDVLGRRAEPNRTYAISAIAAEGTGEAGCDIEVFVVTK